MPILVIPYIDEWLKPVFLVIYRILCHFLGVFPMFLVIYFVKNCRFLVFTPLSFSFINLNFLAPSTIVSCLSWIFSAYQWNTNRKVMNNLFLRNEKSISPLATDLNNKIIFHFELIWFLYKILLMISLQSLIDSFASRFDFY